MTFNKFDLIYLIIAQFFVICKNLEGMSDGRIQHAAKIHVPRSM